MNFNDKLNSLSSKLRGWYKTVAIVVGLSLLTLSVHADVNATDTSSQSRNSSILDALSLDRDPKINYRPAHLSSWLNSLRKSKKNCQSFVNTWDWFTTCESSVSQVELHEKPSPDNGRDVDQSS